jgi:hypothetical protein
VKTPACAPLAHGRLNAHALRAWAGNAFFGYLFLTRTCGARPSGRLRRSRRKRRSAQAKKSNSLATASETQGRSKKLAVCFPMLDDKATQQA